MTNDRKLRELVEREALAADAMTPEEREIPAGVVGVRRNRAKSVVFSVRLTEDEAAEIKAVAAARDVPANALARGWLLDGLRGARHEHTVMATGMPESFVEAELRKLVTRKVALA